MWLLSEAQKNRSKMTSLISDRANEQNIVSEADWVQSPLWYKSLRNDITSVDTLQEKNTALWISDLIKKRVNLRKWIVNWTTTSWNEAADYLEIRRWWLVDIFADYMMQNKELIKDDASAKLLWETIKKDPDAIIWYMKNVLKNQYPDTYQEKNQAIDDYIMKWGKLNDVMNFLTEETADPYWTPKADKLEWTNTFLNFLWSIGATPIKELGGLSNIIWEKTWLANEQRETARKTATVEWASTQWYNEYKETGKLPEKFSEDYENLYKWYDNAVKDWFIGSVEEYNNYLWDVAVATDKTFKQITDEFTEKYLYNPDEAWAWFGNLMWDVIEIVMMELATAWTATPELAATKIPKLAKWADWAWKWIKWWIWFQALEDAYEWELSNVPEYAKSAFYNILLRWGLKTIGSGMKWLLKKWTRLLWWITERGEKALQWETKLSSKEKIDIINESKTSNPSRTPEKEIGKGFVNLRDIVKKDVDRLNEEVKTMERWFDEWPTPETLADRLNENFSKLKNPDVMWNQAFKETPSIRIWASEEERLLRNKAEREALRKSKTKAWKEAAKAAKEKADAAEKAEAKRLAKMKPEERAEELRLKEIQAERATKAQEEADRKWKYEMNVDNKELLKNWYSKDEIALIDVLVEEWNKMFVKWWAEFNSSNLWELTKMIESKSTGTTRTREIVDAIAKTMDDLSKSFGEDFAAKTSERWNKSTILEWLNDVLWRLARRTSGVWTELWLSEAWSKWFKWNLRELLTQANKYYKDIDLNREIDSWLIHLAIYDPETASKIIWELYPSLPWMMELLIKLWKMKMNKAELKNIVNNNAWQVAEDGIWQAIGRSIEGKISEWAADRF